MDKIKFLTVKFRSYRIPMQSSDKKKSNILIYASAAVTNLYIAAFDFSLQ